MNHAHHPSEAVQPTSLTGSQHLRKRDYQRWAMLRGRRRLQFLRAAVVGLLAGVIAVSFQWSLFLMEEQRNRLLHWLHTLPGYVALLLLPLIALVAGAGGWLTQRFAPEAAGSGIPHIKAVLLHLRSLHWQRLLPVKYVGSLLGIGAGLSLGREGPTVQMGAAVGQAVGDLLHVPRKSRDHLIACGGGAGLAAAFNAPLAGFIFVIEEFQRDLSPLTYGTALIAAVTADIVTRTFTGQLPSFHIQGYALPPLTALPLFAVVGLAAGLVGLLFNKSLLKGLEKPKWFADKPRWLRVTLVAALVGVVAWWFPDAIGGGHRTAEAILKGQFSGPQFIGFILILFAIKFVLTIGSYASGIPGGIFAPMLVLGALIGNLIGNLAGIWFPLLAHEPAAFAVAGMAALFAATVRAPLTGIVLILEMTANYNQLFALLIAVLSAHLVAEHFDQKPVYDALLAQDLRRSRLQPATDEEPFITEIVVEPESAMAGRKLSSLKLPQGCLMIRIKRAGHEFVPNGNTVLRAGDEVSIIVNGDQLGHLHSFEIQAKSQ